MSSDENAQTAALQEYFDSNTPAGYGPAFRAGWVAGQERMVEQIETADSVAQMAAHDRDEALVQAALFEQEYAHLEVELARLRAWLEPLEAWASNVLGIVKERRIPSADVIEDGEAITDMARKALRLSGVSDV